MAFVSVMFVPIIYYISMTLWLPRTLLERAQYLVGLAGFVVFGPFINISVMLYAVWNMDSFGWGKTRLVIEDDADKGEKQLGSSSNNNSASELEAAGQKTAVQPAPVAACC